MNSSKPEKSSRRSSILKLPKPRNPSEYGDQAEESPLRVNRRVSFAGKKHVKKFCESNVQGTVWDNTYEESDSSQMKTSQGSISDETPPLIDSEKNSSTLHSENTNHPQNFISNEGTLLFLEDNQNSYSQMKNQSRQNKLLLNTNDLNQFIDKENIPIEPEKIDNSLVEELFASSQKNFDRPENSSPKFSIYCDDDDDDENNLLKPLNENEIEAEKTIIGEESMDCTMTADNPQILPENLNEKPTELLQKNSDKECDIFGQNRMSMTAIIPSVLHTVSDQLKTLNYSRMEITEALPSLLNRQPISPDSQQVFHQTQMEMTTAIPSILNKQKQSDDQTRVFNQQRMSMTAAIPSILHRPTAISDERTQFFQHDNMEMTQALTSVLKNKNIPVDQSQMEMTSAIPSVLSRPCQIPGNNERIIETTSSLNNQKITDDQSGGFNQNRMSMTAAIPSILHSQKVASCGTRFDQSQMEMTSAISSVISKRKTNDNQTNRMSMTAAIPSILHRPTAISDETRDDYNNLIKNTKTVSSVLDKQINYPDESQVILPNRMSMTTALPSILHRQEIIEDQNPMEFTGLIPSILHQEKINNLQNRVTVISSTPSASPSGQIRNNTEELTEPISSLKRNYTIIRSPHHLRDAALASPIPKLQINASSFVKIPTEQDRQALHRLLQPNPSDPEIFQSNSKKTFDISMEFTAAVPPNFHPQDNSVNLLSKSTQENEDNSLETTDPIDNFAHSTILADIYPQPTDENQTNNIDKSQTPDKIIEDIIPSMERAVISSDIDAFDDNSLKENHPLDDAELANNRSVVRELFEPHVNDKLELLNGKQRDEITKLFPVNRSAVYDEQTEKIPVITNCLGLVEADESQQFFTDNLEEIEAPSFCENSHSLEQGYSFEREITENIKIWEKKNIGEELEEEEEEISKNLDCQYSMHQEDQDYSTGNDRENSIDEKIFIEDRDESGISRQLDNPTERKRSFLDLDEEEMIPENNKRCKLELNGAPSESPSDALAELDSAESEKIFHEFILSKLNIQENPETENKIINGNLKVKKCESSLNKILAKIEKRKLELKITEENKIKISEIICKMTKENPKLKNLIDPIETNEQNNPFEMMKKSIENYALKSECIWKIISIDPRRIIIEYYKTSLWLVIGVDVPEDSDSIERIKGVKLISRLSPKEDASLRIIDQLILEGINVNNLQDDFKIYDDILKLVKHIDDKIASIYDFHTDLVKLERQNLMEISLDKISFVSRTSKMYIILKISINVKPFDKITPDDVTVECLVGNLKTSDVQNLITNNIKRKNKFLSFYIEDVRNFISLIEETQRKKKK